MKCLKERGMREIGMGGKGYEEYEGKRYEGIRDRGIKGMRERAQ